MNDLLYSLFEPLLRRRRRRLSGDAIAAWPLQQEALKSQFTAMAASAGKPRGLLWDECEWLGHTRFCFERSSGLITAFTGIIVRFEAEPGGEMEEVSAVAMPRDAVAVFHFRGGRWGTGGRVLFNLTPDEATGRLADQFIPIDEHQPRGN